MRKVKIVQRDDIGKSADNRVGPEAVACRASPTWDRIAWHYKKALATDLLGSTTALKGDMLTVAITAASKYDRASMTIDVAHAEFVDNASKLRKFKPPLQVGDGSALRFRGCVNLLKSTEFLAVGVVGYMRTHALGALTGASKLSLSRRGAASSRTADLAVGQGVQLAACCLGCASLRPQLANSITLL